MGTSKWRQILTKLRNTPYCAAHFSGISLAIVIFCHWNPLVAIGAALIFGAADALVLSLQIFDIPIPPQFLLMLPYLVIAIVISGLAGKINAPANLLQPYSGE